MKKLYLLSILIFGLFNVYSQNQITLTFHAKDSLTQYPLALDSVNVKNLTENCDTTLYDSVSVLTLPAQWPVGIGDQSSGSSGSFILMHNVPNPFRGKTTVRIWLKNDGELNLIVYDNQGKILSQYHNSFEKGWHSFAITTNGTELLFLKVSDNTTTKTIKILSTGPGNEGDRISYLGETRQGSILKSAQNTLGFIFYLGNQLQYTAYVSGYPRRILFDNPVTSETYTFTMHSFVCGDSITINHDTSGGVAPVNKTVTYGTVTNIPGEPLKCWITSNLGADHQATAKNDATEPSAGWYWQFNRKQGYKHNGMTVTPAWTITSINENSDWTAANNPCILEMGNGWRIPTKTEWTNVDANGNWTDWNGPWNSALKMHAAGDIFFDGTLENRGSCGLYWSSTQNNNPNGQDLLFGSTYCMVNVAGKAYGLTLRCIKD